MIAARLTHRESERSVALCTYHMPCVFWEPQVMTIHTSLAAQAAIRFADGCPLVLAGDFNIKPADAPYRLVLDGTMPATDPAYPRLGAGDAWRCDLPFPLRSAYLEATGGEPAFTNYAFPDHQSEAFQETLDYIFLSPEWSVTGVLSLPAPAEVEGAYMPNDAEPSDHLLIQADLLLQGRPL